MTYKKAVERFNKEYKSALEKPFVRDPVAYALYQTWKAADLEYGKDGKRKDG